MDNWILVVGYSRPHFEAAQKERLKYNVLLQLVGTIPENSCMTYGDALITSLETQGSCSDFVVSITMSENATLVKKGWMPL